MLFPSNSNRTSALGYNTSDLRAHAACYDNQVLDDKGALLGSAIVSVCLLWSFRLSMLRRGLLDLGYLLCLS